MFKTVTGLDKDSNVLDVKVKNYGECDFCKDTDNKAVLHIPWSIWTEWRHISMRMRDKEWGAVFWVKDNTITTYKIPKQEVTGVECEFKEELGGDGIVHSHHNMGAFHSSQDDHHARNLYCYSIVVSNKDGSEGTKRTKLPCGGFGYLKLELCLVDLPEIDLSGVTEKPRRDETPSYCDQEKRLDFIGDFPSCETCTVLDCENCPLMDLTGFPCDACKSLKCKSCKLFLVNDMDETLPFCNFCEDGFCDSCERLDTYLKNYPEDELRLKQKKRKKQLSRTIK